MTGIVRDSGDRALETDVVVVGSGGCGLTAAIAAAQGGVDVMVLEIRVKVTGALFHTQGGLRVGADARVPREDGAPVPNLYAGGGVAAWLSGHGPGGYFSGNGLLTALGYGTLAGRHTARAIRAGG